CTTIRRAGGAAGAPSRSCCGRRLPRKRGRRALRNRTGRTARYTKDRVLAEAERRLRLDRVEHARGGAVRTHQPTRGEMCRQRGGDRVDGGVGRGRKRRRLDLGEVGGVRGVGGATEEETLVAARLTREHERPDRGHSSVPRADEQERRAGREGGTIPRRQPIELVGGGREDGEV